MTRPVDEAFIRRRARRVAVQVAAVVAVAMLVVLALAAFLVVRDQQSTTDRLLTSTARNADDVSDPPAGAWLVLRRPGAELTSEGLPSAVRTALSSRDAAGFRTLETSEGPFRVLTVHRQQQTVQVVYDLAPDRASRRRMLSAMGVAATGSLLVAAMVGVVIGRRAVRPLAEALSLQRSFVADASHELRTPLTLLITRVQVLERSLPADATEQLRHDIAGVRSDVHRLDAVVDDLLVAANEERDEERERVDLRAVVEEAVASATPHASERGITVVNEDHGEAVAEVTVAAIRRALLSLIDNAVDHTPEGGQVTVSTVAGRKDVTLTVSDTGPGLSAEEAAHVFDRFRSGGHRAGRAHYGLGLALTHEVVLRHGGRLSVVPSDRGAVFELVLPR